MKENDLTLTDMLEIKIQLLFSHYTQLQAVFNNQAKARQVPPLTPIRIPHSHSFTPGRTS